MGFEYSRNLDDMTLEEIQDLCQDPTKYKLTWGEYMKILDAVQKASSMTSPNGGQSSAAEIEALKRRVFKLETQIKNIIDLFAEFYAKQTEEQEDEE